MIERYGKISRIEAWSKEKDDPDKDRTRKLLCRENQTGLLLDMGVHYFGIISNIEGNIGEIKEAFYDVFPGNSSKPYDVETYVETKFDINGDYFHKNANGSFKLAKFIHKFQKPEEKDSKKFQVTFEKRDENEKVYDSTTVTLDFIEGTVKEEDREYDRIHTWETPGIAKNEYVNILKEFYDSIINKREPRTSFRRSAKSLDAIYRICEQFPVFDLIDSKIPNLKTHKRVYKR